MVQLIQFYRYHFVNIIIHRDRGLVVRPLQTERWRITLSRGINNKSSIKKF